MMFARRVAAGAALLTAPLFALCGVAHADPAPPAEPGCVDPATSLPCSSQLPDINAAIRQELQQILPGLLAPPPSR